MLNDRKVHFISMSHEKKINYKTLCISNGIFGNILQETNQCVLWIYFRLNLLIENFCCDLIVLWTTNSRHCFRLIKVLLSMGSRWRLPCDWKMIISIEIDKNRNSLSWLNLRIYINKIQFPSSHYYCQHIFSLYIT